MILLWALILFGLLIFFHELGHFIFAKLTGVGVLKFSLGFGPALLKKRIGETEYMLSVIPLGGYVKMIGEEPGEELKEEDKERAFNNQSVFKRALIVFAGPFFNLVLAYIIFVVFLGLNQSITIPDLDAVVNTNIEIVEEGSPGMEAGFKVDDKIVSVGGKAVNAWIEFEQAVFDSPGRELTVKVKRNNEVKEFKVTPESVSIEDQNGNEIVFGRAGISKRTTRVGSVLKDSPASKAGLKRGDIITFVNNVPISDWGEMSKIISKHPGKEIPLSLKRGNTVFNIKIVPEPQKFVNDEGQEVVVGKIGITRGDVIASKNIFHSLADGVEAVYKWSVLTVKVVGRLLTGTISAKQIGGPILIVDAAAKAASAGVFAYFNFIAIISINLAILNLLPVPVLDGGHLLFMAFEVLRRKPLSEKVMNFATKIGFAMLMLLVVLVFYNDIVRVIVPYVKKFFSL